MATAASARTTAVSAPAASSVRRRRQRVQWKAYLYVLPAFLVLTAFLLIPFGQSIYLSLYDWDGITAATWTGFANYSHIVTDRTTRASFGHAAILVLFYAAIPVAVGLLLTAVMGRASRLRGAGFFRTVLFLPQVIASVVVATTWVAIYSPGGLANQVLHGIGIGSGQKAFLGDFGSALPAVGLIGTWVEIGLCLVLFVSGVGQIPAERYEAARIDGAGLVHEFFAVTLPGLLGQISVALTLTVIAALKTFDLVYVTTHGGPGNATTVPSFLAYDLAFNIGQVGSASAIGVVLAVLIALITVLITRIRGEEG